MSNNPDPNRPEAFQPGYEGGSVPLRPLDYQTPQGGRSGVNRWWMVAGRIAAGIAAGFVSFGMGFWIAGMTGVFWLLFIPPAIMLGTLLFVCIKYRRFGYVTGFILAPFLAVSAAIILLWIICGSGAFVRSRGW